SLASMLACYPTTTASARSGRADKEAPHGSSVPRPDRPAAHPRPRCPAPAVALAAPPAGSCIGVDACTGNTGSLQTDACVGARACLNNAGSINKKACQAPDTPVGVGGCANRAPAA